jgi:hypothetical protein
MTCIEIILASEALLKIDVGSELHPRFIAAESTV